MERRVTRPIAPASRGGADRTGVPGRRDRGDVPGAAIAATGQGASSQARNSAIARVGSRDFSRVSQ